MAARPAPRPAAPSPSTPVLGAAPGAGPDPFATVFGSGVTASVSAEPRPASLPSSQPTAPATAGAITGEGGELTPQQQMILRMRKALAEHEYDKIKPLAEEYALAFPESGVDEFFLNLARIRVDTLDKRREMGSFLRLRQMGSRRPGAAAEAGGPESRPAELAPGQPPGEAPGAAPEATPFEAAAAGAQPAATPPAASTPAPGAAPEAAPPPALPVETALGQPPVWKSFIKAYAMPAGYGAGGLIAVIAALIFLRKRRMAQKPDAFQEALASGTKSGDTAGGARAAAAAPAVPLGELFADIEPELETAPFAQETGEAQLEPEQEPELAEFMAPVQEEGPSDFEVPQAPLEEVPTPTGTLPEESAETTAGLGLGAAAPAGPLEPTPTPMGEIEDLLSFIPAEETPPPFQPASAAEESTGGLSLDDLVIPEPTPPPAAGLEAAPTPPPSALKDVASTGGFDRQFEQIMFEAEAQGDTRAPDESVSPDESTNGSPPATQAAPPPPDVPTFEFSPLEDTRPSESPPPPNLDFGELEDTKVSAPPPDATPLPEADTQNERPSSLGEADTAILPPSESDPQNRPRF